MNVGRALKIAGSLELYDIGLEKDPERQQRMRRYRAVVNPIPLFTERLSTDEARDKGLKILWKSWDDYIDPKLCVTSQPYIYGNMLEWYIANPEFLEVPLPHRKNGKDVDQLATILFCDDVKRLGNGNHRVAAALLLGKKTMKIRRLEAEKILEPLITKVDLLADPLDRIRERDAIEKNRYQTPMTKKDVDSWIDAIENGEHPCDSNQ